MSNASRQGTSINWGLVLSVAAGGTGAVALTRYLFGLPVLVPVLITACVMILGAAGLGLVLRLTRKRRLPTDHA